MKATPAQACPKCSASPQIESKNDFTDATSDGRRRITCDCLICGTQILIYSKILHPPRKKMPVVIWPKG